MEKEPLIALQSTDIKLVPIVVSGVLVAELIAGGGVYAYQKSQNDKQEASLHSQIDILNSQLISSKQVGESATPGVTVSPIATVTPILQPSAAPDATANWQTYNNSSIGLSFKYPQGYFVESQSGLKGNYLRVSNHSSTEKYNITNTPKDLIAIDINSDATTKSIWEQNESHIVSQLPSLKEQSIASSDGTTKTYYYEYYSDQATDYSLQNSTSRLAQVSAFFTLSNGKSFTVGIDNYEGTPKALDQQQVNFALQLVKTVKAS